MFTEQNSRFEKIKDQLTFYIHEDGEESYFEDNIALFLLSRRYAFLRGNLEFALNVNDVFYYSAGDSEDVKDIKELVEIYKLYMKHGVYGMFYWVAKQRNQAPIPEIKEKMEAAGFSFEGMEEVYKQEEE